MRYKNLAIPVLAFCLPFIGTQVLLGFQEETPEKPAEVETTETESPAESVDTTSQWSTLSVRKEQISLKLADLKQTFETASLEERRKIRDEFQQLIDEFLLEVSPEMNKLAEQILESEPANVEAAEFVLREAWNTNDYPKAVQLADRLIASGHETEIILNIGGASHFAENQFEKAIELLTKAESRELLDMTSGGRYLDPAKDYVKLWEAETALREKEANAADGEKLPQVELTTSKGKVLVELFENEAPNTVANFVSLVENGTYDGVKFHRVIPGFMAQSGNPNTKNDDPSIDAAGGLGYTIACECYQENARKHFSGSLAMGLLSAPQGGILKDSGGAEFYMTHLPTPHLNSNNDTPYNHTVFGRVIEGLDVVRSIEKDDVIEKATVVRKRDHEYKPVTTAKPGAKDAEDDQSSDDEGKETADDDEADDKTEE